MAQAAAAAEGGGGGGGGGGSCCRWWAHHANGRRQQAASPTAHQEDAGELCTRRQAATPCRSDETKPQGVEAANLVLGC